MTPGQPLAERSAALVLNPRGGTMTGIDNAAETLARAIAEAGFQLVAPPDPDATIEAQLEAAIALRPRFLFAAGGDGTLRCVAERLVGTGIVLAAVPGGTMNRLTARLALASDPIRAIAQLARAEPAPLLMARVNGHGFLYQALVGPPVRLVKFRELQRDGGHGWRPLLLAGWRSLRRPLFGRLAVQLGRRGRRWRRRAVAAVLTVPEPGRPPLLQVGLVGPSGIFARLAQAVLWLAGQLHRAPSVEAIEAAHIIVHSRQATVRVALDGEMLALTPPLRFSIRPAALSVLAPATRT